MQKAARHLLLAGIALLILLPLNLLDRSLAAQNLPATLRLSHPGGYYDDDFLLSITAPPQSAILFTLDGRIPTHQTGTIYTQPILISRETAVTVLRACLIFPNGQTSPVSTATYFVGIQSTLPLLSLVADPADLYDLQTGIYANPAQRGATWERPATITYLEADHISGFQAPVGIRINGASTRVAAKKSWRVYFRQEYGQNRLDYPLFDDDFTSFKRLIIHSGTQDSGNPYGTLLRAHLFNDLAAEMGLVTSRTQPVLLFVNGQPAGIYLLRNRIDDWFLADKYGIHPIPEAETGARWEQLNHFAATHDLCDPDNYAYIASQIDIDNFIDYHILQIYAANTDWIFTNMRKFQPDTPGGRLQWIVWDMDWAFGLDTRSGPDFDMMAWFETNERFGFAANSQLIRQLWRNPGFQAAFRARAEDLLATTLAEEKVAAQIDTLAAELRPDIGYENGRWPNPGVWEANVAYLRDFARQRPYHLRQHLINYFDHLPEAAAVE